MKIISVSSDKLAVSLSMLCVVHCLAFPLILALLPAMSVLPLPPEAFHLWMIVAVIPISIYALTLGCKKHKKVSVVVIGIIGLLHLVSAVILGESLIGEAGEKLLTVIGAVLISFSHYRNFNLCKAQENCPCPSK